MRPISPPVLLLFAALSTSVGIHAQQAANQINGPRLIRFNGAYRSADQPPHLKVVGAIFSIYRQENDGTPLWNEIQNIQPDKDGSYTVLLGSTRSEGIPVDLFISSEPRWLEVEIDQVKQPRILLGSVPYAMKASDADTLGGLPPSAYLRVPSTAGAVSANSTGPNSTSILTAGLSPLVNSGSPGCIGIFTNNTDLICSAMTQSIYQGNPAVGIGVPTTFLGAMTLVGNVPNGDAAGMALYNAGAGAGASVSLDMYNTPINGGIPQAKMKAIDDGNYSDHLTFWTKGPGGPTNPVAERVRITSSGNVGIGTTTPATRLEVNGNLMVDGNINLSGIVQSGGAAIIQSNGSTNNVALGPQSLTAAGGTNNTAIGSGTLTTTTGIANTAVGYQALNRNSTGALNVALGYNALQANQTGNRNTAVGSAGLQLNQVDDNTAIGYAALVANTTGTRNTALGSLAMGNNSTSSDNTALGYTALMANTGANNTAVGSQALANDTTGNSNVAVGTAAAQMANPVASVAVGAAALFQNTNGIGNTAVGWSALNALTSGSQNVALGYASSQTMQTGSGNVTLGYGAAVNLTSGTNNIVIGNLAGQSLSSGFSNIYIAADAGSTQEHGAIRIGNIGTATSAWLAGVFGVQSTGSLPVLINNQGQLFTIQSSRRYKEDIQDMGESSAGLMRLRPVTFRYKKAFGDGSKPLQYGLIAEEVAEVYPDLVVRAADGQIESVQYHLLPALLLNEVQRLNARNIAQEQNSKAQEEKIQSLEERLVRLESLLERTASPAESH